MAVINVLVKDSKTLELQEDAKKGDTIDLNKLGTVDTNSINEKIKQAILQEVEEKTMKELETKLLKKEKELRENYQSQLSTIEKENIKLKSEKEKIIENEKNIQQIEMNKNIAEKDKEIYTLKAELERKDNAIKLELERKESQVNSLTEKIKHQEETRALETERVLNDIKREKEKLEEVLNSKDTEYQLKEKTLKEQLENKIREKDEEVAYYKELKIKTNIKMLGETVEKHCHLAFEQIRGFLPATVKFGKDTDASEGSMGDRIYREFDTEENEVLSIMFEMKNEGDETKTKQKNEHFFKELDKDRIQKKCEYAVLVTMLERDNELYNNGFYTVPESDYKDMFVIRPQDFTKIIMWLRNVAGKLSTSRRELITIQQRDRDYTEFDILAGKWKDTFTRHVEFASKNHNDAVVAIDKAIKDLQNTREALTKSNDYLRLANKDFDDLTVKKLAKNSPSIQEQIKKDE